MDMKVIQAFGPGDLRVVNAPVPSPGDDEVLIRVRASGICGSDKWIWRVKEHITDVAGHEIAGEVSDVGRAVTSLRPGARVVVNNVIGCGRCPACRAGAFVRCEYRKDATGSVNNGYGEYAVAPARNCQTLDARLSFTEGALLMDNWGTPYGAVSRLAIAPGDVAVVFGLGPIGQAAVALLKLRHAFVVGVDPVAFRQTHALSMGADRVFTPANAVARVRDLADGIGAHWVLECSGHGDAYEAGLSLLRVGGTLVTIGEEAEYTLRPSRHVLRRALAIQGSWYSTMPQGYALQQLALTGQIDPTAFVTHRIQGLEAMPAVFGDIVDCKDGLLKAVIELS